MAMPLFSYNNLSIKNHMCDYPNEVRKMETYRRLTTQPQHILSESSIRRWGFVRSMVSLNSLCTPAGKADEKETWDPGGL